MDMTIRPRRLRGGETIRKMVRETRMDKSSLIYPLFVMEGENLKEEIPTMPGTVPLQSGPYAGKTGRVKKGRSRQGDVLRYPGS